jgi:hypothetical protein
MEFVDQRDLPDVDLAELVRDGVIDPGKHIVLLGTTVRVIESNEIKSESPISLEPGQLWWDERRCWCDGSESIDAVFLILSADRELGLYFYRCAMFMWCRDGYCGADDHKFTEDEVRRMTYVGNIASIKSFK